MNFTIRKANNNDIKNILNILSPYVKQGILLPRNTDDIANNLSTFSVAVTPKKHIGVISFYKYNNKLYEIRSLAVDQRYHHHGVGKHLVEYAINDIVQQSKEAIIFCLTYNPVFFKKTGFLEVEKNTLPHKIWKDCQYCKHRDNCTETAMIYKADIKV